MANSKNSFTDTRLRRCAGAVSDIYYIKEYSPQVAASQVFLLLNIV